jgi:hypothetical protein
LDAWQREVYDLAMQCGISKDREAGRKLDAMKRQHPRKYEQAFRVWSEVMAEILYD